MLETVLYRSKNNNSLVLGLQLTSSCFVAKCFPKFLVLSTTQTYSVYCHRGEKKPENVLLFFILGAEIRGEKVLKLILEQKSQEKWYFCKKDAKNN